jgi:glutathione synthase/RimK-type ligase-like ATP-grasp enzyme
MTTLKKQLCFLSMNNLEGFYTYDHLTARVLEERGWTVRMIPWKSKEDWTRFDAVIIRSPWDYQHFAEDFLKKLSQIHDRGVRILNHPEVIRWNIQKQYLLEMEKKGIPIVPTLIVQNLNQIIINRCAEKFESLKLVVKPTLGAGAEGTFVLEAPFTNSIVQHAIDHYSDQECMVQPFMEFIETEGEFSLMYFNGKFSHAIRKTPKMGDFRVQEEHGGTFRIIEPSSEALELSEACLRTLPENCKKDILLYARMDLVRRPDGNLAVMEWELIEPSLYLSTEDSSHITFANAIEEALQ